MKLPVTPSYSSARRAKLDAFIELTRVNQHSHLSSAIREDLRIDLTTRYGGVPIAHPFGKASGQLSCTPAQVEEDVRAGLAFIVLKTAIAEVPSGERSMEAWTVRDTRMVVERLVGRSGREGWTVTWTGRGWHGTLEEYLDFFRESLRLARDSAIPIVPSVKFHLPPSGEQFRTDEYSYTTEQLLHVWDREASGGSMILEKDFSPTLAGDARSADKEAVLRWLDEVPKLVESAAPGRIRLGIKVMNALEDDEFQLAMLNVLCNVKPHPPPPAFLVVFNRLFDETRGVAYGGWDLSDRNLRVLEASRRSGAQLPPLSATGNICSGRMMLEYAFRGCENGQVHTFFQVPRDSYTAVTGSRSSRALHTLLLHPTEGLVPWLWHLHEERKLDELDGVLRFCDVIGRSGSLP